LPRLSEQLLIPHDADNLYELVRDIRGYPDFIRWIRKMNVSDETEDGQGAYTCTGEADVHFKGFDETFSTSVKANKPERTIEVRLARGPFRHLKNRWQFDPQPAHLGQARTRVHFFIDYEFKNPILGMLARSNSRLAVDKIMGAFRAEADRRFK
jgi:coenzyme Q-binding protein COQ10